MPSLPDSFFDTMGTMTAIAGGVGGVLSNTSYIESAAGVGAGARTGLASVVTGVLSLFAIFLSPLVKIIPSEAAVHALVLVGLMMMQQVKGIGAGFVAYVLIKLVLGKVAGIHPLMWMISALFVLYFAIHLLTRLLT
jgi:AGZA family xanthine/uracil permease-like MFS transporter